MVLKFSSVHCRLLYMCTVKKLFDLLNSLAVYFLMLTAIMIV